MKSARFVGIAVLLFLGLGYFSLPCACVTLAEIADDVLVDQSRRALDAQQAFFVRHGRHARTVVELEHEPAAAIDPELPDRVADHCGKVAEKAAFDTIFAVIMCIPEE